MLSVKYLMFNDGFTNQTLLTKGRITTTDFPVKDVKFYISYYMDYNIGLIAQLKINTGK